jgi:phthalate 4,5-dioxygenase
MHEVNELLTRVGPGTPMGALMRQYWIPALASTELPALDCAPVRVKLLGESLIGFRDSEGRVGLLGANCPHRGASLFFGRNEEQGLRCVYHGWKYDLTGQCVDMPSEPPESTFKDRIRHKAYPCVERGGLVWTYMGYRATPPPLPDIEPNMLAGEECLVGLTIRDCNWLQALEGDIDTGHFAFLHTGAMQPKDFRPGTMEYFGVLDRTPRYQTTDLPGGTMYGAYRPTGDGRRYWRIACFLFPFYALIPTGAMGAQVLVRAWVPLDDTHTMFISMSRQGAMAGAVGGPIPLSTGRAVKPDGETFQGLAGLQYHPNTTDWYGRFRLVQSAENDYLIDREKQRTNWSFTGIDGIPVQDQAVTESMGEIYDRSEEHLGSSDAMVARTRARMLRAVKALRDEGTVPPGVDDPTVYRVRSGGLFLPEDADWIEATQELRQAFVDHPELDLSIVGRD